MADNNKADVINVSNIIRKIWKNKKTFIKPLIIVFVLSSFYIVSFPRYYRTEMSLAPEMENAMSGGALGSLASSFGIDLGNMQTSDAISPILYPDLMDDNGFVARLFPIHVKSIDGEIEANYYDYRKKLQKKAWWDAIIQWIKNLLPEQKDFVGSEDFNPYWLSKKDDSLVKSIQKDINFSVDKKTGVITVSVRDQDPYICKCMADSVTMLLQQRIIDYRTNKARIDVAYYCLLADSARIEYEKAANQYSRYADSNTNAVLVSYQTKLSELENDMQMKFNTYSVINTQLQTAKGKVQERTPAFTILKGASVPIKPAGPKRMLFVIGMLFLCTIGCILHILKDDIKTSLLN